MTIKYFLNIQEYKKNSDTEDTISLSEFIILISLVKGLRSQRAKTLSQHLTQNFPYVTMEYFLFVTFINIL